MARKGSGRRGLNHGGDVAGFAPRPGAGAPGLAHVGPNNGSQRKFASGDTFAQGTRVGPSTSVRRTGTRIGGIKGKTVYGEFGGNSG